MRVHRNGVTFNNWHYYDESLSDIIGSDVVGKYSLSDYSKIFCFYKNQFVCVARPIEQVHPMISESEAPENYEAVKRISATKNRIKRGAKNLLTLIEGGGGIDSDTSFQRSPDVAAVVKAIEGTQETPKMISAFPDDHAASVQVPAAGEPESERPWFRDEYERYRWVMQQQVISQDDRGFIDDFRARSLLYKNIVFTDQKLLNQKVISSSREAASDEGSLCNRS